MYESHLFESTGGATVEIADNNLKGQRLGDGHRNAQISVEGLAGGTFDVFYRVPRGTQWIAHVTQAGANDTVMLAGALAPLFVALKIEFTNVPVATVSTIIVNSWARGL
jgi:hypothetical protein